MNKSIIDLFNIAINLADKEAGNKTQYGILVEKDTIYLSIQGSVDLQDWLYNFYFIANPYKNMKSLWFAHGGFSRCWKLARDEICRDIQKVIGDKKLVITGYSHGAALAILAHEFFTYHGYNPETHVFGCPRVLWLPTKKVEERFSNLHIYQNKGDIVAHLPFAFMGFFHVGNVKTYGKSKSISVSNHFISNYTSSLSEVNT